MNEQIKSDLIGYLTQNGFKKDRLVLERKLLNQITGSQELSNEFIELCKKDNIRTITISSESGNGDGCEQIATTYAFYKRSKEIFVKALNMDDFALMYINDVKDILCEYKYHPLLALFEFTDANISQYPLLYNLLNLRRKSDKLITVIVKPDLNVKSGITYGANNSAIIIIK